MAWWKRNRRDDVSAEIDSYVDHETDENIARGMTPEEARAAARRKFGNSSRVQEAIYEMRGLPWLDELWRDGRLGVRQLLRNPAFALAGIGILAMGVMAVTVVFSMTYGVLLRDLPYDQPDRLVAVGASLRDLGITDASAGGADYFDWRSRQRVFEDIAMTRPVANFNLTGAGEPERLFGARTTASLFSTLRVTPLLGRTFTEEEQLDPAKASSVAVLSYALWQRRFGGDPSIVGRKILLNGDPHVVLGVMRPEFRYPSREFELWLPLYLPPAALKERLGYGNPATARLKPGVTLEQAQAQMNVIAADLAREYPDTNRGIQIVVEPMLNEVTGSVRRTLWVLLGAVGVLFLAGCLNLANLLLARAASRSREFSIRASLGATRGRLARQSFAETIPLAAGGCLLGVAGAFYLLKLLIPLLPASVPRVDEIGLHIPVLLAAVGISAAAACCVSLASTIPVRAGIVRGPASRTGVRDVLIVTEIACTVVLLVTAGLLMRSFLQLRSTDPGFQAARVLSFHLKISRGKYGDDPGVARHLSRLIDRVRGIPGIESVGIVNRLPLAGQTQMGGIRIESSNQVVSTDWRAASGDYFRTMGIPLLSGRTFTDNDGPDRTPVGIIDDRLAREVFGTASPLGKRFRIDFPGMPWVEIVGVAGHLRNEGLNRDPRPQVYWPYQQRTFDGTAMVAKTSADPTLFVSAVRAAIREVDPDQAIYDARPMDDVIAGTLHGEWLNMVLLGTFAAAALLLASVGLYGVVSYLTSQRRKEFGIRVAIGARSADVLGLVLKQGLVRAAGGLGVGLLAAAAVTSTLGSMLYGVRSLDWMTYASVAALLAAVVLLATFVPAWRASRIDPTVALRQD